MTVQPLSRQAAAALDAETFAHLVRDALAKLYDPVYLQTHPLAALVGADEGGSAALAGRRLEAAVVAAVDELAARAGLGSRGQALLRARYVEALEVPAVCRTLDLSRSQFYVEHRRAVDALTAILSERWGAGRSGAASAPAEAPPTNLPEQLTSFVGREREVAEVTALVRRSRLVTLTGAGGVGKTRLALRVGAALLGDHADGVFLVDLAPLLDPALVVETTLTTTGGRVEPPESAHEALVRHLRPRRTLVLLDNCEHVVDAAARLVEETVRTCPAVHVLATSRELLGVPGESAYRVPSLALPDPGVAPTAAAAEPYSAVRLFVDRATQAAPGFAVTDGNARAVVEVCARLDGIPLAIELAAARVRALPVDQIAARLHDRFRLLTGGRRTALRRQQTLQATVDWSHNLLTEPERVLLRRLAVFAGGWTLEAAEQVCGGDPLEPAAVLDLLTGLIDKSLVVVEGPRYRCLETIRQYAEEKLRAADEAAVLRDRHRDHFAALAARQWGEKDGPSSAEWLRRVDDDYDNVRAALGWCRTAPGAAVVGLRLAAHLGWFWFYRGLAIEGKSWLEAFLAASPEPSPDRLPALFGLEEIERQERRNARAAALGEEALALAQALGEAGDRAEALARLGIVLGNSGDVAGGRTRLEESAAILRRLESGPSLVRRLLELGTTCLVARDYPAAAAHPEESVALARSAEATALVARGLQRLAILRHVQGDHEGAWVLFRESEAKADAIYGVFFDHWRMVAANFARAEGSFEEARAELTDIMRAHDAAGRRMVATECVCALGILEVAVGRTAHGVRLIAASAVEGVVGTLHTPEVRVDGEDSLARARAVLGEEAYQAAWGAGRDMGIEEAIGLALNDAR